MEEAPAVSYLQDTRVAHVFVYVMKCALHVSFCIVRGAIQLRSKLAAALDKGVGFDEQRSIVSAS